MNHFPVETLLLHADKMMLLDRVIDFDNESLVAETKVRDDGLFGDAQLVPAWLGMEYMAQTIGAHAGAMSKLAGRPIVIGFLLGTRRYTSYVDHFKVGDKLTIKVKKIIQDQGLSVFESCIIGDTLLAEAKINVYQPGSENKQDNID